MSIDPKQKRWLSGTEVRRQLEISIAVLTELTVRGRLAYRTLPGHKGKQYDRRSVEALAESCVVTGASPKPKTGA